VPLYEIGEYHGQPFFSMGLIEGESLQAKIAKGGLAPELSAGETARADWQKRQADLVRLLEKVAWAVHHAHQRGVLHRDLKPANILIDAKGEPHLTDFGLAKILEPQKALNVQTLTAPNELPGTPSYMSPEQAAGASTSQASDIYGLGAVMYVLLTGRPPFTGATPLDTIKQVVEQPPLRPRTLNPLVHRDLGTICLKCLEKNPLHRYVSAEALAEDLQRWLAKRPIKARPVGPMRRTGQWIRRNPVGVALMVSLFIGLTVSLALLRWVYHLKGSADQARDEIIAEYVRKIDGLWTNPEIKVVTLSSRELTVMFERSVNITSPKHELTFGITTGLEPSTTAQKYADWLGLLENKLAKELGAPVAFGLKLFKMGSPDAELLAQGRADFMLVSAVDYLKAREKAAGVLPLAHKRSQQAVIFTRADSGLQRLDQLRGKSIAFPTLGSSMTIQAKALLADAGVFKENLRAWTNFVDQGPETGQVVASEIEPLVRVLKREFDAGVTSAKLFEPYRASKLAGVVFFTVTPDVYVAKAGLPPQIVTAFQKAVTSGLGLAAVDDSSFNDLRAVLRKIPQFDNATATNSTTANPNKD
jgi:ABC-type phosphate/phosphonate transport system substrate-binding protein